MFSISRNYKTGFIISTLASIISVVLLFVPGLHLGIDFRGGTLIEVKYPQTVSIADVTADVESAGFSNIVVQQVSDVQLIIKTSAIDSADDHERLIGSLFGRYGTVEELRFDSIGTIIGEELKRRSVWQGIFVCVGILLYVAYAFRNFGDKNNLMNISSWRLSWAALIALAHDIIILLGVFVVLGMLRDLEIDTLFVTAVLTTLGFSVNDTIVVFDRLRENVTRYRTDPLSQNIDRSINETMTRSLNTSCTLLFVLLALALFGGQTVFYFVIALMIGVIVGTYSSIFIASPLLLIWNQKK